MADVDELEELDEETRLDVDPDGTAMFLDFFGRKNSGKSHLAELYARSWPYDGLVINSTGDVDHDYTWTLPWPGGEELVDKKSNGDPIYAVNWPERPEGLSRAMWNLVPNRLHDPHYRFKIDAAIAALHEAGDKRRFPGARPRLLWVDEIGEVAKPGRVLQGFDTVLHQGRHNGDWCLFCGPRPMDIETLVLGQADWIFCFALPAVADVQRVAKTCGISEQDLAGLMGELGDHEFVRIDQGTHTVALYPPVPS
ncbi:MAG: hypothetical protein JWM85_1119 [Acidimicrobiaceae bacterium]|nr:hypothetical protein [Acidimicrobiaceae bacterium]